MRGRSDRRAGRGSPAAGAGERTCGERRSETIRWRSPTMCKYCNGYWECDGEGGEGNCLRDRAECDPSPAEPGWKRTLHEVLRDAKKNDIVGPAGPIRIEMKGRVDQQSHTLTVEVNGFEAPHTNDGESHLEPHKNQRDRRWHINCQFPLREKGQGGPVLDKEGKPVWVRVQAYPYEYVPEWHKKHDEDAKSGWGPKMRIWAV